MTAEFALTPPLPLTVLTMRLTFRAESPLQLPRWKGATLRGGLGHALRGALCDPACPAPDNCSLDQPCAYRTLFAPEAEEGASDLRGVRDATRAYVVRPPFDERTEYPPGSRLTFGLVLIGAAIRYLPHVLVAFDELGKRGLGNNRGQARLESAESYDPLSARRLPIMQDGRLHNELLLLDGETIAEAAARLGPRLRLHLRTPLRIKHNGQFTSRAECHIVIRAALRRISQLCALYGAADWQPNFGELIRLAEGVTARDERTHWVDWSRTSGVSGRHMTLGGIVGSVTFDAVPAALRSILLTGSLVHIGKSVVFGHGDYAVESLS